MEKLKSIPWVGIVVAALSVVFFIATFSFQTIMRTHIGPEAMPRIVAVVMFLSGIGIIFEDLRKQKAAVPGVKRELNSEEKEQRACETRGNINLILSMILMIAYVFTMVPLGFIVSSIIYIVIQSLLLYQAKDFKNKSNRYLRYAMIVVIAIVASLVIYYGFVKGFKLLLPEGILG